jgi:hypothetical protein
MKNIVPEILALNQYLKLNKEKPELLRQPHCPYCGKLGLWCHGHYDRKADRQNSGTNTFNPVPIPRFFCPHCGKTCSTLPECIPPRRWYLWDIQQIALLMLLAGKNLSAITKKITPSRHTLDRWFERLKNQLRLHKDALCQHFIDLGQTSCFTGFWATCLKKIPLSKAMYLCHVKGVTIP